MEIPDRYHARFVVLKDESEELEFDSTFTISLRKLTEGTEVPTFYCRSQTTANFKRLSFKQH